MAEREVLTAEYVRQILIYDPETGLFTWRDRPIEHFKIRRIFLTWNTRFAGKPAGSLMRNGYWVIIIDGKHYLSHRVAWLHVTGSWPKDQIDHADCDRSNNRFSNLREANSAENSWNVKRHKDNASGRKGVNWHSKTGKWRARIKVNGKTVALGYFNNVEDASAAYQRAALEFHGDFARPS